MTAASSSAKAGLFYEGRPLSLIGHGMSRLAYSDGAGTCVKIPVRYCEEAGILQNRAEAEAFEAGKGLGVFPELRSLSGDGSTLAVEECGDIIKTGAWIEFDRYNRDILEEAGANLRDFGCRTPLQRVAWGIRVLDTADRAPALPAKTSAEEVRMFAERALEIARADKDMPADKLGDFSISAVVAKRAAGGADDPWAKLVRFWAGRRDFVLQEMWHDGQWGVNGAGDFVVVDMGFTKAVQGSAPYRRDAVVAPLSEIPPPSPGMFCGTPLSEIVSPKGSRALYGFRTSKGSEYVLTGDGMSRRVKRAGLQDDGLHRWSDLAVFVGFGDLVKIMDEFRNNFSEQRPTRLVDGGSGITLQTLDESGDWEDSLSLTDVSRVPVLDRHVCEFMLGEGGVVRCWHFGHDVTEMQEAAC